MKKLLTILVASVLFGVSSVPPCWGAEAATFMEFFIHGYGEEAVFCEISFTTDLVNGPWEPHSLLYVPPEGVFVELPIVGDVGFYRARSIGPPPPPPGG